MARDCTTDGRMVEDSRLSKDSKPYKDSRPWIIKYLPKSTAEIVGQDASVAELKQYIVGYRSMAKKAAFIYGPSGSGKTCSVYSIAAELGFEVVEVNASDFRNQDRIRSIIGSASKQMPLFAKGKVILVDEVDGLSGTKDRGALQSLAKVMAESSFPLVMTAMDPYQQKLSSIRTKCRLISYSSLSYTSIYKRLVLISGYENIAFDEVALKTLARRAGGDMRAAINDLQTLSSHNGSLVREDLESLSEREQKESLPNALVRILKTTDPKIALGALDNIDEDMDTVRLWIDENLPYEYTSPEDLARAYDYMSKADVFSRRIRRWQHWRFMVYINAFLTAGIAVSKDKKKTEFVHYRQSMRPLRIWQAKMKYAKRLSIAEKIAARTHTSLKRTVKDTLPYVQHIISIGGRMSDAIIEGYDLDKDEVSWIRKSQ
ncbi:replication factor C large subunit [Candidatus Woesearchaeota archaeon]|nr:replication factor C large subunit [Candidatus Woesearchaeota archaeon]